MYQTAKKVDIIIWVVKIYKKYLPGDYDEERIKNDFEENYKILYVDIQYKEHKDINIK